MGGVYEWRSENDFGVWVLSRHVGSGRWALVIRLGGKCLYLPSRCPKFTVLRFARFGESVH